MIVRKELITSCKCCDLKAPLIIDPDWVRPTDPDDETVPPLIDDPNWKGVPGYTFKRDPEQYWEDHRTCIQCMDKQIKAIGLINTHKLTSAEL